MVNECNFVGQAVNGKGVKPQPPRISDVVKLTK